MNKKLYVGGLPYSVTDEQLMELFESHGTVESAKVITDRYTDRSRGFGFVEMSTQEEAEKAIQALNGTELEGRSLTVNVSKPREDRSRSGGISMVKERNRNKRSFRKSPPLVISSRLRLVAAMSLKLLFLSSFPPTLRNL